MSFMDKFMNGFAIRLITRFVFLHILITVQAVAMPFVLFFSFSSYFAQLNLVEELISDPQVVDFPIVDREKNGYSKLLESYWCFVRFPDGSIGQVYRDEDPKNEESLSFFERPIPLHDYSVSINPNEKRELFFMEVPEPMTKESVFELVTQKTILRARLILALLVFLALLLPYLSIVGFIFIKGGRRPKKFHRKKKW